MVNRFDSENSSNFPNKPKPSESLPEAPIVVRSVMVPVFIRVDVPSEDADHAECRAVEQVRALAPFVRDGSTFTFASVISPLVKE